jgi:inositol transport system substrate-binding protein
VGKALKFLVLLKRLKFKKNKKRVKNMSKKLLVLTMALIMTVGLFIGTAAAEEYTVGVLIADFSDQFQVYMMDGMKQAAAEYDDIEFIFQDAKYDAATQMNQAENLMVRGADAIVLMPVDASAAVPMTQRIVDEGIGLITVNRTIENQEIADSYVGSDSVESGEILMQAMADKLNGEGKIAVLQGQMGHEPQIYRQQGIENVLENYPDIEVVATQAADWYRDEAMNATENWLQGDMELDAIVAHNDEMAIGALIAAKDAGAADDLLIAGIDATPEALDYVEKGELAFTVFQDAKGQGRESIHTAADLVHGKEVPEQVMIPYELVTPDEVDKYRAKYE